MLEGFSGFGSTPLVNWSSCNTGASGLIASRTSMTCGSTSYSTLINLSARLAIASLIAATAATGCPSYKTFSRAIMLRVTSRKLTINSPDAACSTSISGKSSRQTTALTPGSASASDISIDIILARACGLRSTRPINCPGSFMSEA